MANDGSPSGSARGSGGGGGTGRRCTRVDLLIFLLAAALCSASYCLGVWHNSRGAADSRVLLGPSAAGATYCEDDADAPLDFGTHHAAEDAGLSVSSAAAAETTTGTRRALRGGAADDGSTAHRGVAWAEAGGDGTVQA